MPQWSIGRGNWFEARQFGHWYVNINKEELLKHQGGESSAFSYRDG